VHPTVKAPSDTARAGRHDPPNADPDQRDASLVDASRATSGDHDTSVEPDRLHPKSTATAIPRRIRPGGAPRRRAGRARRVCAATVLGALAVIWVVGFRPQVLGGPVSYVHATTAAMAPTIADGDIVAAVKRSSYHPGDIIVYRVPHARSGAPTHALERIVYASGTSGFVVKADNLPAPDSFHPRAADIVGKVWFHYPHSLLLPLCLTFAAAVVFLAIAAWPRSRRHSTPPQAA